MICFVQASKRGFWLPVLASVFLICYFSKAQAGIPHINVPFATTVVSLDGKISADEWADSAVVRNIYPVGEGRIAEPNTVFYLKYDNTSLFVAAICRESDSNYPQAYKRVAGEVLTDDDAVQVVLGIGDSLAERTIDCGGYEGASGQKLAPVAHYYEYTVNFAEAVSRTYNETMLKRPLFDAKTGRFAYTWIAEFRIPFSSAGIEDVNGTTIYANLFRFRPPQRTGWYLPNWGPYTAMPFGTMTLLKPEESSKKTIESVTSIASVALKVSPPLTIESVTKSTAASATTAKIEFYPLNRMLVGTVDSNEVKDAAFVTLSVKDMPQKATKYFTASETNEISLILPETSPSKHTAVLDICDKQNKIIQSVSQEFEFYAQPQWFGTKAGIEYIDNRIPRPWTKPVIESNAITLAHCKIVFGPAGLPQSITDDRGELLASAGRIEISYAGQKVKFAPKTLTIIPQHNEVLVCASQTFEMGTLETRTLLDYDGFMVIKFRVVGCEPAKIDKLQVCMPLKRDITKFVNRGLVQDTRLLNETGYRGPEGYIWVGGYDKGLAFSFDTPLILNNNPRSAIEVAVKEDSASLLVNIVGTAGQVTESGHIFRFLLQPTPTKKNLLGMTKMRERRSLWFENWSDYQGYPDLSKMAEVKKRSDTAHSKGQMSLLYFGGVLAENSPGFKEFRNDLIATPERLWYRRAYNAPGKGVACYLSCVRGPWGDELLYGIERLMKEGEIDGVYMDGTSYCWDCGNPSHSACDITAKLEWEKDNDSREVGTRKFLKRLRGIFDERNKPYLLDAHTGGGASIFSLSLCDMSLEGEQLSRYRSGYHLPPYAFAVGYSGSPWGRSVKFLPMLYETLPNESCYQAMTYTLLHDTELHPHQLENQPVEKEIFSGFQDDKITTFYPYWRPQPHVQLVKGDVMFSYYRKSDSAMLIASNFSYDDQDVEFDVSNMFDGPVAVTDVEAKCSVPLKENRCVVTVKAWLWKAIKIERIVVDANSDYQKQSLAANAVSDISISQPFHVTVFDANDWQLSGRGSGLLVGADAQKAAEYLPVLVTSKQFSDHASYSYVKHTVLDSGAIKLKIKHNRIEVVFGSAALIYNGVAWSVRGADPTDIKGQIFNIKPVTDRVITLEISLKDGVMDAVYDGKPLVRNLVIRKTAENKIVMRTWGGDCVGFDLIELSSQPVQLFKYKHWIEHPIQ